MNSVLHSASTRRRGTTSISSTRTTTTGAHDQRGNLKSETEPNLRIRTRHQIRMTQLTNDGNGRTGKLDPAHVDGRSQPTLCVHIGLARGCCAPLGPLAHGRPATVSGLSFVLSPISCITPMSPGLARAAPVPLAVVADAVPCRVASLLAGPSCGHDGRRWVSQPRPSRLFGPSRWIAGRTATYVSIAAIGAHSVTLWALQHPHARERMRGATVIRLSHEDQPVRIPRHCDRVPLSRFPDLALLPLPLQGRSASRATSDLLDMPIHPCRPPMLCLSAHEVVRDSRVDDSVAQLEVVLVGVSDHDLRILTSTAASQADHTHRRRATARQFGHPVRFPVAARTARAPIRGLSACPRIRTPAPDRGRRREPMIPGASGTAWDDGGATPTTLPKGVSRPTSVPRTGSTRAGDWQWHFGTRRHRQHRCRYRLCRASGSRRRWCCSEAMTDHSHGDGHVAKGAARRRQRCRHRRERYRTPEATRTPGAHSERSKRTATRLPGSPPPYGTNRRTERGRRNGCAGSRVRSARHRLARMSAATRAAAQVRRRVCPDRGDTCPPLECTFWSGTPRLAQVNCHANRRPDIEWHCKGTCPAPEWAGREWSHLAGWD